MNDFFWIIEFRQLWVLLAGIFFLLPIAQTPDYSRGQLLLKPSNGAIYLWLTAAALSIALTPEATMGGDKINYTNSFLRIASGMNVWNEVDKDVLFSAWMYFVSRFTGNPTIFFLLTTTVYVGGLAFALKRIGKTYWAIMMIAAVFGLGFFSYGDNTLRSGMAYSLLLVGVSFFTERKAVGIAFACLAIFIHHSMLIPVSALAVALFYRNTKVIFLGWIFLLIVSIVFGNATQEFLAGFFENAEDQRMTSYALGQSDVYKQGFRLDFLIYGFVPIALGLYYRYRKRFEDPFYLWILNTYIIANGFWLLMIRAVFTDRFAYLSWGLMPIVLFYPLIRRRIWANQSLFVAGGLFLVLALNLALASRTLIQSLYQ